MKNPGDIYSNIRFEMNGLKSILTQNRDNQQSTYLLQYKYLKGKATPNQKNNNYSPSKTYKISRAQNQLKKPSQLQSKYNFAATPEMTVKNLMHTSSFDHMIFLCQFEYMSVSSSKNIKNNNFQNKSSLLELNLNKHTSIKNQCKNINTATPFINFIRGVCYYDKRKNDINKKYRVAMSLYYHYFDEFNTNTNLKENKVNQINNYLNNSFNNHKTNNHIIDGSFIHNQQIQQKECLNYQSRHQTQNQMCNQKIHKKKPKQTQDGHRKTQKCLKDQINDSPQIASLMISNPYNSKSQASAGRVTMFTEGNEIKESKKRIKSNEITKMKKLLVCDRQTVMSFFRNLTHVPTYNEDILSMPTASIPKRRSALISDKQPIFRAEILERDQWHDAEDEEYEEKQPQFDFSWFQFNREDRQHINPAQVIQGHHGLHYTSKIGMYKMLTGLVKYKYVDIEWFFPRSYDLCDKNDLDKFIQHYLANQCLRYIQNVQSNLDQQLNQFGFNPELTGGNINKLSLTLDQMNNIKKLRFKINKVLFKPAQLIYCLNVVNETLIEDNQQNVDFLTLYRFLIDLNLAEEYDNIQKLWVYRQYDMLKSSYNTKYDQLLSKIMETNELDEAVLKKMLFILNRVKTAVGGGGLNRGFNRWILKPHDLSRGRAITVHSNLGDILDKVEHKHYKYIVQKYIEKPLLYKNRKFDIRVWTLLTSSAPVINWVYQKFQIRLSSKKFDINNDDKFVNLTNQAIQKNSNTLNSLNDECMLDCDSFRTWFVHMQSKREWELIIRQIQGILGVVSLGGNEQTERRLNVYTVLGWDFMVDTDLNVWLIECNRSPDLNPTTHVTEKLVKEMFKDLADMFSYFTVKDLNNNDSINNIGQFLKINDNTQTKNIQQLFKC